jgi:sugar phosphate isomerase/epimerase
MKTTSRRSFLKAGFTGLAALPLYNLSGCSPDQGKKPDIGLQMYTFRNELDKDFKGTLEKISGSGFKGMESAFLPDNVTIAEAGKLFREYGLSIFAAHVELPVDEAARDEILEISEAYACKRMIWHGWPEDNRYKTETGTRELSEIYQQANEFARSNGLHFGIHNHWWEYEKQDSGRYPYEIMLEELDEEIFFEIDTYWVTVAGHDPAEIIRKFGKRAPLIHIKDGPAIYSESLDADEPDPMVSLGTGVIDIPAISSAGQHTVEWMIVELDVVKGDVFKAVQDSYDFLVSNNYASGIV